MKKHLFILVSITLGLCACNLEEPLTPNDTLETPTVYHMSIPASFDAQTKGVTFDGDGIHVSTQFEASDKIYVYNETKGAFARSADGEHPLSYLQPTGISGSSCTLEGDLTFWKKNNSNVWETVTVEDSDKYNLYYQMNDPNSTFFVFPTFNYTQQDGSASSASSFDFAEATGVTMSLSGTTLTVPDGIQFKNLQSMFRQRLSFTKAGSTVTPNITRLMIDTKNGTLLAYYLPTDPSEDTRYQEFSFIIEIPVISGEGDIFLSLAFYYSAEHPATGDQLIITAFDDEGNRYRCAKDVPDGGFAKSKYYHGSMTLDYVEDIKPTVTRSNGSELEPDPDVFPGELWYDIYKVASDDHIEITIDGDSEGYRFFLNSVPAIVTLTGHGNPVSSTWTGQNAFIESDDDLTVILDCNYVIDNSADYAMAIECGGNLKLATNGDTQTLTVITNDDGSYAWGIYGDTNWDCYMIDFSEIANLAASGFTVSCPGPEDNGGGTYKWVYTVTPKLHTVVAGDLGKVVGANGEIYDNATAATTAGTTAEAMIAYVGNIAGVCEHGLAIALTDFTQDHDPDPYTTFQLATSITAAEATTAIPGGTWRLPTEKDWQYMIWGSYVADRPVTDASEFISKLTTAGGTSLVANSYWTNTSIDADTTKGLQYDGASAGFDTLTKTDYWHVRAVLSF